jgi:hypothetical protein
MISDSAKYHSSLIMFLDIICRLPFYLKHLPDIGISCIDWAKLSRVIPEDGDKIQSPKRYVVNKKQKDG